VIDLSEGVQVRRALAGAVAITRALASSGGTMMGTIYTGDAGVTITLTARDPAGAIISLVGATVKQIYLQRPGGVADSAIARAAQFTDGTGANGQLRYTLDANDIDAAGLWSAQARVTLAPGARFRSLAATFIALDPL